MRTLASVGDGKPDETLHDETLHVIGIGSMAVDRVHRSPRILGGEEKGILRDVAGAGPVREYVGGVVLNHLGWAALFGLRTGIFGLSADDAGGRFLRSAMDALGIEHHIATGGTASTVAEIFIDDAGERAIYMAPGATSETTPEHVREVHAAFIARARRITTEISQLPLDAVREVLRIARENAIPTVLDLDVPPSDAIATLGDEATLFEVLAAADILKPAKSALRELFPDVSDALALARAARDRFGSHAVLVTDGEAGCAVAAADYEGFVPARAVSAVDTTGAGDAFLGGLLAALEHGLGWESAARLANACGAACVQQLGAFPDDPGTARTRIEEALEADGGLPFAWGELRSGAAPHPAAAPNPAAALEAGRHVLDVGARELGALAVRHRDSDSLARAAELIALARASGGRVHVTGVGKAEHVARYGASLLASTGTPATFLHATETLHGSLGQLEPEDVVVAISNSGTTTELCMAAEAARARGCRVIAVARDGESRLASVGDVFLDARVEDEGGPLGLAPRASVAAEVLVLAALGAVLQERQGFGPKDYAERHPAGALGDRARGKAGT